MAQDPWAELQAQNAEHAQVTGSAWDLSIRERAAQNAEKRGTAQDDEEGRLVARYLERLASVEKQYAVVSAMYAVQEDNILARIADAKRDLEKLQYEKGLIPQRVAELTERDRMMVREYMATAPQFQDGKRKSWTTPWGKLIRRKHTSKQTFLQTDDTERILVDIYSGTDLVKITAKAVWGEIKKRLVVCDDGRVADAETGEIIPAEAVQVRPASSEEHFVVEIGGHKIDLTGGTIDGRTDDGYGADGADTDDDPFADPAEDTDAG